MGIRISEMEEATTFGADDYVPIVTNGTNKKALGAKIKNFIAGFFVNKSGDTMTGDLNINSNNARTKYINPNMTLDTSANNGLSSDSSYGAYFTDKNGNAVGDVSMTTRSTGRNYAQLMARNKKTDGTAVTNYIDVIADKDGSTSYDVSNPAAFRNSIGLSVDTLTLTPTVASGVTSRGFNAYKCGALVIVSAYFDLTRSFANNERIVTFDEFLPAMVGSYAVAMVHSVSTQSGMISIGVNDTNNIKAWGTIPSGTYYYAQLLYFTRS